MTTGTETDPRESHLKYCDICFRSEIDAMVEDRGELINIEWDEVKGCAICDDCRFPHQAAYDWISDYSDGGELCIECSFSRPEIGSGHTCTILEDNRFDHTNCPALPESYY